MALGFTKTSSDTATATSTAQSQNMASSVNKHGANYFYGFLITFIILLGFFMTCGLGTRRRFQRRTIGIDLSAWEDQDDVVKEPILWEPTYGARAHEWNWETLSVRSLLHIMIASSQDFTSR
jgi:hypothetical protein